MNTTTTDEAYQPAVLTGQQMGATIISGIATQHPPHTPQGRTFHFYRNLTFASLFAGYIVYYLCRYNLYDAYLSMHSSMGMDKMTFGALGSFGTLTYAVGKMLTGSLVDSRGGRALFLTGMIGSSVACFLFGISSALWLFYLFWGLNRFFQSMGWGSMVKILAQWFPKHNHGTVMGLISVSYQLGAVVTPVFAGLLLKIGFGWRELFIIPAILVLGSQLIIRFLITDAPHIRGFQLDPAVPTAGSATHPVNEPQESSLLERFKLIFSQPSFLCACGLSFNLTLIRECFTFWLPSFFSEMGSTAASSILKSALLPFLGCVGSFYVGWSSDRHFNGKRGPLMILFLFALAICLLLLGQIETTTAWLQGAVSRGLSKSVVVTSLVAACGFFLYAPYSLIGGVIALDCGGKAAVGTAGGVLDSIGYIAATLAGVGLAYVITHYGWATVFHSLFMITGISVVLSIIFTRLCRQLISHS